MGGAVDLGLFTTGVLMLFAGFTILALSYAASPSEESSEKRVRAGGVVIVGPIPIIFGSDRRAAYIAAAVGALLTLLALAVTMSTWGGMYP
ncbi:MAG: DUF131 domain-containing protein [Desulfurococcales archaeon]|nr:DUF131 domain-containing protein [Desulfurococcales archaeon]